MKFISILIIISIYIINISCLSRALYLDKEKCFYDNYYTNMNIIITYQIMDKDVVIPPHNKNVFRVYLQSLEKGSDYKIFYSNKLSGKFAHSIEESDRYKICIYTSEKELFKNKRFLYLRFKIKSHDEIYEDENSAMGKDFHVVNETMQKLNGKVETIEHMQKYQLDLEDKFSVSQISSSSRLAYLSLCQIIIICVVGIYHVLYLRKIFKDKIWTPF